MTDPREPETRAPTAVTAPSADRTEEIRAAHARRVAIVGARPERAVGTAVTTATVTNGLTCEVEEGPYRLVVDMPERWGGNGRGPNPGVYGRAALASCLAMSYVQWAAAWDLPIDRLEVEVEADYDARGELGVDDDVTPAYTQVRYTVRVETEAPEEEVRRVFDHADEKCPYLHVWSDPLDVRRELEVSPPTAGPRSGGGR